MPTRLLTLSAVLALGAASTVLGTTWNEPWHEDVVKNAESFVKLEVTSRDETRSFKGKVLAHLAGEKTPAEITVDRFYMLNLTSTSSGHGPELRFNVGFTGYFFLKKAKEGESFAIATPTAGFAAIQDDSVKATYRHSYHQAKVEIELYEKTQVAIFEFLHGRPHDKEFMSKFLKETLVEPPQELGPKVKDKEAPARFFRQHVALECFYHFGAKEDAPRLEPFLEVNFFHVQVSAARALSRIDTPESRARLVSFIEKPGRNGFAKVMAVWGLKRLDAKEALPALERFLAEGADEKTGFGGNIMDPRVGTHFPGSVKNAIRGLLVSWKAEKKEK
jgi:hypothetical protein